MTGEPQCLYSHLPSAGLVFSSGRVLVETPGTSMQHWALFLRISFRAEFGGVSVIPLKVTSSYLRQFVTRTYRLVHAGVANMKTVR